MQINSEQICLCQRASGAHSFRETPIVSLHDVATLIYNESNLDQFLPRIEERL